MINPSNGDLTFDSPAMRFSRRMTLQQLRAASFFSSFKPSAELDTSFTYRCETAQADGSMFDVSVRFFEGVIDKLELSIVQPPRADGNEYFHRGYLRGVLGDQPEGEWGLIEYKYEWGHIAAGEAKGQESDIVIISAP